MRRTGIARILVHTDPMSWDDTVTVEEARTDLAALVERAAQDSPTVITRNGVPAAALVSITEFEALEDAIDRVLARQAQAVPADDGPPLLLADVLADLWTRPGADRR